MICHYDFKTGILLLEEDILMPTDHDIDEIGICPKCSGQLKSLSGHFRKGKTQDSDEQIIVSACTICSTVFVNIYDSNWSWINDAEPELVDLILPPDYKNETQVDGAQNHKKQNNDNEINDGGIQKNQKRKDQKDEKKDPFFIPVYSDIINTVEELNKIPREQLLTIFSKTEIDALIKRAGNEKYIRQYYHRAKKKYQKFEEIFGIKINI